MNRPIKFRAWDRVKKDWAFGYETLGGFHLFGEMHIFGELRLERLKDLEVMQFTGLTDKNGKEIYEGDILMSKADTVPNEVIFRNGCFGVWVKTREYGKVWRIFNSKVVEAIGNIYENPELLNQSGKKGRRK